MSGIVSTKRRTFTWVAARKGTPHLDFLTLWLEEARKALSSTATGEGAFFYLYQRSKNMNNSSNNKPVNRFDWERDDLKAKINSEAKEIMWAYAMHGSDKADEVWPGVRQIAPLTRFGQGKVERTRKELIATGWLTPSG